MDTLSDRTRIGQSDYGQTAASAKLLQAKARDIDTGIKLPESEKIRTAAPKRPVKINFSVQRISFTVLKGQLIQPRVVKILSELTGPVFRLVKTEAKWLHLPDTTDGLLTFGPRSINSNIKPGQYHAMVTCTADGHIPASLLIDLQVIDAMHPQTLNIDFQDPKSEPPLGYLKDYGQPFGWRSGKDQGTGLVYGWKDRATGKALNLTPNGRNRNTPDDVLLATLVHMQANHIANPRWKGVKREGYWEIKVPNGTYDVTVAVGDGRVTSKIEKHSIFVEGKLAINKFVPNGKKGTISRFKSATVRVDVKDELLTLSADGGTSTKINSVSIKPVTVSPYVFTSTKNVNLTLVKGSKGEKAFSMVMGNSNNASGRYELGISYGRGAKNWLHFDKHIAGRQPAGRFDYAAAEHLPVGIYHATLRVSSGELTSALFSVQINVVDGNRPYVVSSTPLNGTARISLKSASIAANNLHIPAKKGIKGGVNNTTITNRTVMLLKLVDSKFYPIRGTVQGTGGGDVISFTPTRELEPNTIYKFVITRGVKSYAGAPFAPYEATFTTDEAIIDSSSMLRAEFTRVPIPGTRNKKYTSLTIGPDGKFYALRLDGLIDQFTFDHKTGLLTGLRVIKTLVSRYGLRSAIGMAFDPESTPENLILWVSHSSAGMSMAPAFDGNISRLEGSSLQREQLMITNLPRSKRDHMINGLAFGPDGALYMSQGSNSSAGLYDADWQRHESLLAGTVLRLDKAKLRSFNLPLDVKTTSNQRAVNQAPKVAPTMSDGTYNPYGSKAPVTIFASGVRNAYDLLWHSNGQLYLPTNGSGGGGNSPASVAGTRRPDGTFYTGPRIPVTTNIQVQHDWLFRINPNLPVGYFGHPNPMRGEYVLNRGPEDNSLYLPSVKADKNYRTGYDLGLNKSPNGVIEYKSNAFRGALQGKILVCRFSGGGDIIVLEPGSIKNTHQKGDDGIYDIIKVHSGSGNNGLVGMSGFGNPLDIVEDTLNGNLYVIEHNWNDSPNLSAQITLLRVKEGPEPAPLAKEAAGKNKKK
ncbi:Ig-like domain-containing protein [Dyadobacter sandarakinus]|uniref:Ig-like domain-containing protein n=1 Tax=Dyadobacter sandarakinus TaxID=2747268 RepID=A0ABX7I1Z2_9BACT|nr:Ig-like domain-containing protein [Dyadobacter sandarakinus]QRQ99902.1 Ig-like domain-containing protein [Dyadobacter sandarakinus]